MTPLKIRAFQSQILILTGLLFAFTFQAQAAEVKGLVVVNNGSVVPAYAPAYEYTSLKFYSSTFRAELPNGKIVSGTAQSVAVNLEFAEPSAKLLEKMESVSATNTNAAKLLKPRIEALKSAIASGNGATPEAGAAGESAGATATSISLAGREFKQVRSLRIGNQALNFTHANGAASIPLPEISLKSLKQLGGMSAELQKSREYEQAIASYMPMVMIRDDVHFGVKVLAESEGELTLMTDAGRITCKLSDVSAVRREALMKTLAVAEVQPAAPPATVVPNQAVAMETRESSVIPEGGANPELLPVPQLMPRGPAVVVRPPTPAAQTEESVDVLTTAANAGDVRAMAKLGFYYLSADKGPEWDEKAFHWFKKGAETEDGMALLGLGRCYENGFGTAKDPEEGFRCYKLAAENGNKAAYFDVGLCHSGAIGTWADSGMAVYSFEEGAKLGNSDCMTALGICYQYGVEGVIPSGSKAVEYYQGAIRTGGRTLPVAQMNLAKIYLEGNEVPKDVRAAVAYFKQAADGGNEAAMNQLGHMYRNEGDFGRAFEWYQKGARAGNLESLDSLGYCYLMGDGVTQNPGTAVVCFEKAALAGNPAALYHLGYCYVMGLGVTADLVKARSYLQKSADAGCQPAQKELDILDGKAPRLTAQQEFFQMMMDASLYDPEEEDARNRAQAAQMREINHGRMMAGREPIH